MDDIESKSIYRTLPVMKIFYLRHQYDLRIFIRSEPLAHYSDIDPNIEKCLFDLMRQVLIDKILVMVAKLNQVVIELALHSFHMQYPYKIKARLHWR